jgi:hypothetical protein
MHRLAPAPHISIHAEDAQALKGPRLAKTPKTGARPTWRRSHATKQKKSI